jgi:hypothetical protein
MFIPHISPKIPVTILGMGHDEISHMDHCFRIFHGNNTEEVKLW